MTHIARGSPPARRIARAISMGHYQRDLVLILDDAMFGLIAGTRLYFKVDAETEPQFAAAGAAAFTYLRRGKQIAMSYREAPFEVSVAAAEPAALLPWAELGLNAARRARGKRRKKARAR